MQKIIKQVNQEKGFVQITTPDERWYVKDAKDEAGLPTYQYVPSVTWITHFYYKSTQLIKWIASQGWDEAEAIKKLAGGRGSKVHQAISQMIETGEFQIDTKVQNKDTGAEEELSVEEYFAVTTFADWFNQTKPEIEENEIVVWNDQYGYAGTVDLLCKIDGVPYIVDIKTSPNLWPEMELQLSAYKHALGEDRKLAILQVGYERNKIQKYKFTEVEDCFPLFLSTKAIWLKETKNQQPRSIDLPLVAKINAEGPNLPQVASEETKPAKMPKRTK